MSLLKIFTLIHTIISLVAIASGFLVMKGLADSRGRQLWTFLFLCSAALTTITGFFFPFHGLTPAFILGLISIVPLTLAFFARYRKRLVSGWRRTYALSVLIVLYFNCFVLIVQSFQKIQFLNDLAPTQTEAPFQIVQAITLLFFIGAAILSFKNFQPKVLDPLPADYDSPHLN